MASKAELELQLNIGQVLQERGILLEGEAVGDYVVQVEITNWTEDGRGKAKYANIVPGEYGIPLHRAVGLIQVCSEMLEPVDE